MASKKDTVALYIRVSTEAQRDEGYSIEAQTEMLEAHCKVYGFKKYELYIDGGFSGANMERPELQRMIQNIKDGKISHVIVYKLDRLSRSLRDTLYLIEEVFTPHGTSIVSIKEQLDTSTATGRVFITIISAFAQLERETIFERTRMGMKKRVETGLWMGGGRVPFGYDYDREKGILVPNKDAETVKKIYQLYLDGYSRQVIADMLGLQYERLVTQILMRKSNAGYIVYNGEEYLGQHEPIISVETYNKAMELMQERSIQPVPYTTNLLTGLVYCGKCGAKMRYQKWGKYGSKFVCYSQQNSKKYLIKDPNCDNQKVWVDEIENAVIRDLFNLSVERTKQAADKKEEISPLDEMRQQYDMIAAKIKRLYNLYATSEDELLLQTIEENQNDLKKLRKQMEKEQSRNTISNKVQGTLARIENIKDAWEFMTIKEKQEVVRSCVEKVIITDNEVEIRYNFGFNFDQERSSR